MRENVLVAARRDRRRRGRADPLAGAQVLGRLRPHAAVHRLGGHARADHRGRRCASQPTPEAMAAAACAFADAGGRRRLRDRGARSTAIPVARIELLDDVQIDAVNRHFELDLPVAPTLFLEFHGDAGRGRGAGRRRSARSRPSTARAASPGPPTRSERRALWHARHGAYEAARALRPGRAGLHDRRRACRSRGSPACIARDAGATSTSRAAGADRRPRRRRQLPRRDPRRPGRPRGARARARRSTSGSCGARSRSAGRAPASTASATARRASSSSSTARRRWR